MTSVVVVDDHPVVRAGHVALQSTRPGVGGVGEAASQAEALSVVGRQNPDVVLMDLQLGADDGVTTTRALRNATEREGADPDHLRYRRRHRRRH